MSYERHIKNLAFLTLRSVLLLSADQSLTLLGGEWGLTKSSSSRSAALAHFLNMAAEATGISWD